MLRRWHERRSRRQVKRWLEPAQPSLARLRVVLSDVQQSPHTLRHRRSELLALLGISVGTLREGLARLSDDAGREATRLLGTLEWLGEIIASSDPAADASPSFEHCRAAVEDLTADF